MSDKKNPNSPPIPFKSGLSPEDQALWDDYTADLSADKGAAQEEDFATLLAQQEGFEDDKVGNIPDEGEQVVPIAAKTPNEKPKPTNVHPPQIDRRTADKLRKGKIKIEGRLDLHGLNQNEAFGALQNFIEAMRRGQKRCGLVITGKGKAKSTSDDGFVSGKGVLKQNVPQWLSSPPLSQHILKITPAHIKDGGSGALYVYLKK